MKIRNDVGGEKGLGKVNEEGQGPQTAPPAAGRLAPTVPTEAKNGVGEDGKEGAAEKKRKILNDGRGRKKKSVIDPNLNPNEMTSDIPHPKVKRRAPTK